ncbi:MAG: hypothetical protein QXG52_09020 [Candidatus Caldarchaeum sp.]
MNKDKVLRRLIKLGSSRAVTLPTDYLPTAAFVWLEKHDNSVVIKPAEVK